MLTIQEDLPAGRAAGEPLCIQLPGGRTLSLRMPPDASAAAVVRRAAAACGLAPSQLALFCGGRRLGDTAGGARGGRTLRIVQRLAGGGAGAGRMWVGAKPKARRSRASKVAVGEERMTRWKERGGAELEAALASGDIALLDSRWMIDLAARGGVLKPRQALPVEAFLTLSEIQASTPALDLPVVCVSYCWLQSDQPDPHGHSLRAVARALGYLTAKGERVGVFIDFCSIHQNCRDHDGTPQNTVFPWLEQEGRFVDGAVGRLPAEDILYKQALGSYGTFYSHPHTHVLMLSAFPPDYFTTEYTRSVNVAPYFDRGWCFCESSWATMIKNSYLVLNLCKDTGERGFNARECRPGRTAPVLPEEFVAQLASKGFANGSADSPLVARLYSEGFEARFGAVTELSYFGLGWGIEEARAVARLLPRAPALQVLGLVDNSIGNEGARVLAEALPRALALTEINLSGNSVGDAGACALAEALPRAPALKKFHIWDNSIGDEGACALAKALMQMPALVVLSLGDNSIGDEGARALAEALSHAPALVELRLDDNSIGDVGGRALAEALPRAKALKVHHLDRNNIGEEVKSALRTAWGSRGGVLEL